MTYRVHLKFSHVATVEAESREDAVNQVLHAGGKPKLHRAHCVKEQSPLRDYLTQRRESSLPRWREAWEMKKRHPYRVLMAHFGRGLRTVAKWIESYEEHLLRQKTK